jgi:hypothetical protein
LGSTPATPPIVNECSNSGDMAVRTNGNGCMGGSAGHNGRPREVTPEFPLWLRKGRSLYKYAFSRLFRSDQRDGKDWVSVRKFLSCGQSGLELGKKCCFALATLCIRQAARYRIIIRHFAPFSFAQSPQRFAWLSLLHSSTASCVQTARWRYYAVHPKIFH